nr:MAG TPA: hypothetical protein [Bacteriophage sp.]
MFVVKNVKTCIILFEVSRTTSLWLSVVCRFGLLVFILVVCPPKHIKKGYSF